MNGPEQVARVQRLIAPLLPGMTRAVRPQVRITDHPYVQATHHGGGSFSVSAGLLAQPDEIVQAVMAHELGHAELYHERNPCGLTLADVWFGPRPEASRCARTLELDADRMGARLLRRAGLPLLPMFNALRLIPDTESATHPGWRERSAAIASLMEEEKEKAA